MVAPQMRPGDALKHQKSSEKTCGTCPRLYKISHKSSSSLVKTGAAAGSCNKLKDTSPCVMGVGIPEIQHITTSGECTATFFGAEKTVSFIRFMGIPETTNLNTTCHLGCKEKLVFFGWRKFFAYKLLVCLKPVHQKYRTISC